MTSDLTPGFSEAARAVYLAFFAGIAVMFFVGWVALFLDVLNDERN